MVPCFRGLRLLAPVEAEALPAFESRPDKVVLTEGARPDERNAAHIV